MDKNKIDGLFKRVLDQQEHPFEEDHWKDLEERISRKSRNTRPVTFWKAASVAACIASLLLIGLNRYYSNKGEIAARMQSKGTSSFPGDLKNDGFRKSDQITSGIRPSSDSPIMSLGGDELDAKKIESRSSRLIPGSNSARSATIDIQQPQGLSLAALSANLETPPVFPRYDVGTPPASISHEERPSHKSQKQQNTRSPLQPATLSILAGPDLTRVAGSRTNSVSTNFALVFSQPIGKRFSLTTGIGYAKKNYSSNYSLYRPLNPIPARYKPTNVDAACDILSIPISVNMKVAKLKDTELSVGLGTSSLFMLKEEYIISYSEMEDRTYTVSNENKHLFSTIDLTVSIQHKVSDKLKIGIRPFFQIPVKGVGYGRTSLESKGVALSLDFRAW